MFYDNKKTFNTGDFLIEVTAWAGLAVLRLENGKYLCTVFKKHK